MPEIEKSRTKVNDWAQHFNVTFVLKSADYYDRSLDSDNDLFPKCCKKKKKQGGREE